MSYILAIDGGGSKTHALLANEKGEVLGEGRGGATNVAAVPIPVAVANMHSALQAAVADKVIKEVTIVLGLAGADTPEDIIEAQAIFKPVFDVYHPVSVKIIGDVEIALANGSLAGNAICLIAGTGSNCYGRNQAGMIAKTSGMGQLLTDQGSGYEMGLAALKIATKSFDGRIPHSQLQELILQHFAVADFAALNNKVYEPFLTKPQIAELTVEVEKAAQAHDHAAQTIVAQTVAEWLEMVQAVLTRLSLLSQPTDLVLAGSLTKVPLFYEPFAQDMRDHFAQVMLIRPEKSPVYGALALALH